MGERWMRGKETERGGGRKVVFFFFNDTATTEIYTLSLHDALPISNGVELICAAVTGEQVREHVSFQLLEEEALAAILRSEEHTSELQSHVRISYAVFCLKKKKKKKILAPFFTK